MRGAAFVFLLVAASSGAAAQSVPVYQMGTALQNDLAKFQRNGEIRSPGGISGDNNGIGANPFSVTDYGQLGFCSNSNKTTGPYTQVCIGHDAAGNGLITFDWLNGATAKQFNMVINGVSTPLPGGQAGLQAGNRYDPRAYGLACDMTTDNTAVLNTVAAAVHNAGGGSIVIPCPIRINGQVILKGATRLTSDFPAYYPGQSDIPAPSVWPPTKGAAINCYSLVVACISLEGEGIEIDHINFGNPMTTPPMSGTWAPQTFPYVLSTRGDITWQGLNIHDVTFTSTSKAIDLEGTTNYAGAYAGSQIMIDHVWCNVCTEVGIRLHLIDNPIRISNVEFTPAWYFDHPPMGRYMRDHSIGFDIQYVAAPIFNNIGFFAQKSGIRLANDTITNNFGTFSQAISAAVINNIFFNQVCQAITTAGNGEIVSMMISNMSLWGDQSGFECSKNLSLISLPTNDAVLQMVNVQGNALDTLLEIGCGVPGVGGCPGNAPGGGSYANVNNLYVDSYGYYTASAPMVKAPSTTVLNLGSSTPWGFRKKSGSTGPVLGPGLDGTTTQGGVLVGAGLTGVGGVAIEYGGDASHTGVVSWYGADNVRNTYMGWSTPGGLSLVPKDVFVISPQNTIGSGLGFNILSGRIIVGPVGSTPWPSSCAGLPTGTLWNNAGAASICP
jgi:hypothetical protein